MPVEHSSKDAKMTSAPVKCKNNPDDFCYVCGEFDSMMTKKPISKVHERAYLAYFGCVIGDQNEQWVPHFICRNCHLGLLKWMNDCGNGLSFAKPMVWHEPHNHTIDCYFCLTQFNTDTGNVDYANVISIAKPIPNNPAIYTHEPAYTPAPSARSKSNEPQLILPNELDLLIRGLNLSERSAEILVKTFQEWKILAPCKYKTSRLLLLMELEIRIYLEIIVFYFSLFGSSKFSSSQNATSDVTL